MKETVEETENGSVLIHENPDGRGSHKSPFYVASGIIIFIVFTLLYFSSPLGNGNHKRIVDIPSGATARKTAEILEKDGFIRSSGYFLLLTRLYGKSSSLKAGPYLLTDSLSPSEIMDKIVKGDIYIWRFAVPEGYSIYQLAEMIETRKIATRDAFLSACFKQEILQDYGISNSSVEGRLYPSTYMLIPGSTPEQIVKEMLKQFNKEIAAIDADLDKSRLSLQQILTLASMVEKEAIAPSEKPVIASVFYNRLKKRMRLQSDPTAVYGKKSFGGKVTAADVRDDSPYNTYTNSGLPPGPIGNPGIDSIKAALNPSQTSFLYFSAKKDGTHYFSTNLEEHNRAVAKYLKNGR